MIPKLQMLIVRDELNLPCFTEEIESHHFVKMALHLSIKRLFFQIDCTAKCLHY